MGLHLVHCTTASPISTATKMGPAICQWESKNDAIVNSFPPGPNHDLAERALGIGLPPTVTYRVNSAARAGDTVQVPGGSSHSLLLYFEEK